MEGLSDFRKLVDETNACLRAHIQLWVQGFTFVLTANFIALGWFVGEIAKGSLQDRKPLQIVAYLFAFMNIIAISVSFGLSKWFGVAHHDLSKLYALVEQATEAKGLAWNAARISATRLYRWTVFGGIGAIGAVTVAWCFLSFA